MPKVIFVDDESHVRKAIGQTLELAGYKVDTYASAEDALPRIDDSFSGVVLTDHNMPGMSGLDFLHAVKAKDSEIPVILLTGHGDISIAVDAMRSGAYDFLEKPFSNDTLIESLTRASEKRQLSIENRQLKIDLNSQSLPGRRILGNHPTIKDLRNTLLRVKDAPADVLVNGETGTGKEMVARFLHNSGQRHNKPFVAINCGAIPENMIEAELFGYEAGAFADAKKRQQGKFEFANGGTLFLDEIESMPMPVQIKILRVLEERQVQRLGGNESIDIDVRIVAATKENLLKKADAGEFRADLYYRLNVVQVHIPALRDRRSDIPLLFEHFVLLAAERFSIEKPVITPRHIQALSAHDWPGNVRELRNVADCFVLLGEDRAFPETGISVQSRALTLAEQLDKLEEQIIRDCLQQYRGRLKDAQESLGVSRKTLYDKMKKHMINKHEYKTTDDTV